MVVDFLILVFSPAGGWLVVARGGLAGGWWLVASTTHNSQERRERREEEKHAVPSFVLVSTGEFQVSPSSIDDRPQDSFPRPPPPPSLFLPIAPHDRQQAAQEETRPPRRRSRCLTVLVLSDAVDVSPGLIAPLSEFPFLAWSPVPPLSVLSSPALPFLSLSW